MRASVGHWVGAIALLVVIGFGVACEDDGLAREDVDGDGSVRLTDAVAVHRCSLERSERIELIGLFEPADEHCDRADVDGDGIVDEADVVAVLAHFDEAGGETEMPAFEPDQTVVGADDVLYLLSSERNEVLRWHLELGRTLSSIATAPGAFSIAVNADASRLYVNHLDGHIDAFDLARPDRGRLFHTLESGEPGAIASVGELIVHAVGAASATVLVSIGADGAVLGPGEYAFGKMEGLVWSEAAGRLFFVDMGAFVTSVFSLEIDPETGEMGEGGIGVRLALQSRPPPPPAVNEAGDRVVIGGGTVFDVTTLEPIVQVEASWIGAAFVQGNEVVGLLREPADPTIVEHRGADGRLFDERTLPGTPVTLVGWRGLGIAITSIEGRPTAHALVVSDDADEDGVINASDAFPRDPAASVDTDEDGYPDAWNSGAGPDDSPFGLSLDAFPADPTCQTAEHSHPLFPDRCDIARSIPTYTPTSIVTSGDDTIYLLSSHLGRVFRWSTALDYHIEPFELEGNPGAMAVSDERGLLYLAYREGFVSSVPLSGDPPVETRSFDTASPLTGVLVAGDHLVTSYQTNSSRDVGMESHTLEGERLASRTGYASKVMLYDETRDAVIHYNRDSSSAAPSLTPLDPANGTFGSSTVLWSVRSDSSTWMRLSPDRTRLLIDGGGLVDVDTTARLGELPISPVDAAWVTNRRILTLRESEASDTIVEQWRDDLRLEGISTVEGPPIAIVVIGERVIVVTAIDGRPVFDDFEPSDDTDGDTVHNDDDAFPTDPSASVDTDADGYPDAWNPGFGPEDSTLGLELDAFPFEDACQTPDQARFDDPTECDLVHGLPEYRPTSLAIDDAGVVYLLSAVHQTIFRYRVDDELHMQEVPVGESPSTLGYSPAHGRLYVGYADGTVTYLDVTQESPIEQAFLDPAGEIRSIVAAGSDLLLHSSGGRTLRLVDQAGAERARSTGVSSFEPFFWNAPRGRAYFSDTFGDRLSSISVDLEAGTLGPEVPSPFGLLGRNDLAFAPGLTIAPEGDLAAMRTGNLFSLDTLDLAGSIPTFYDHASWLDDGRLVTAKRLGDDTAVAVWATEGEADALTQVDAAFHRGSPLAVLEHEGRAVVVTSGDDVPEFLDYTPGVDGDGDGVAFSADEVPLDPAASLDTDRDGAPDSWNPGYTDTDSVLGLAIDVFPLDSACQLVEDGFEGMPELCDVDRAGGRQSSSLVAADASGIVYLTDRSWTTGRVERYSMVEARWLNPVRIRRQPTHLVYAAESDRIYVGNESGVVEFFDASAAEPVAELFTTVWHGVRTLVPMGSMLLVGPAPDSATQLSAFDVDGDWLSTSGERGYSAPTFDPATWRLFSARDSDDLLTWAPVDPATGVIGVPSVVAPDAGIRGEYVGALRLSADGASISVGDERFFDAATFAFLGRLTQQARTAAWLSDGRFVTLEGGSGSGIDLEVWTPDLELSDAVRLSGWATGVVESAGRVAVVTSSYGGSHVTVFEAGFSGDGDGDGVDIPQDAFPFDPAAATDTDYDGHPDEWVDGQTAEDSLDRLEIDAFPLSAACQTPDHGLPGAPSICDVDGRRLTTRPTDVAFGRDGRVYLLSESREEIARFDLNTGRWLDPVPVGEDAYRIAFTAAHDALYLGYLSGTLTRIEHEEAHPSESTFATERAERAIPVAVGGLLVGLSSDDFTRQYRLSAYDALGSVVSRSIADFGVFGTSLDYAEATGRLYLAGDAHQSLAALQLDPETGRLEGAVVSEHTNRFANHRPVRARRDGSVVSNGKGDLFDGATLEFVASTGIEHVDAVWIEDAHLIAIRTSNGDSTVLERFDRHLAVVDRETFPGVAHRLLEQDGRFAVVTLEGQAPAVHEYATPEDRDGDGVAFDLDAFPLDPAASLDADGDGAPDAWNDGYDPDDSTDGLVLDEFPADPLCQLARHGIDGRCDVAVILPARDDEALCAGAVAEVEIESIERGSIPAGGITDVEPLCRDWLAVANTKERTVSIIRGTTGQIAHTWALHASPGTLVFDEAGKRLYVTLPDARAFAEIDLVGMGTRSFETTNLDAQIALGQTGEVLLGSVNVLEDTGVTLWTDGDTRATSAGWLLSGDVFAFNAARDELLSASSTSTQEGISRYSFDRVTGPSLIETTTGIRAEQIEVSPDGSALLMAPAPYDAGSYWLVTRDASDPSQTLDAWRMPYPVLEVGWSRAAGRIGHADRGSHGVIDTESGEVVGAFPFDDCRSALAQDVELSDQGDFVFTLADCIDQVNRPRIYWATLEEAPLDGP